MGISEKVSQLIKTGSINNIGIQQRLHKYKRTERKLAKDYAGRSVMGNEMYRMRATGLANSWVDLVVDISAFSGEPMGKSAIRDIRDTLCESVYDSVGPGLLFDSL